MATATSGPRAAAQIVVAVDGSSLSIEALRWAVRQARLTGAGLTAVTAWEVSPFIFVSPTSTDADDKHRADLAQGQVVSEVLAEEPDVQITRLLVEGRAGIALSHAARGADLLVMGAHGHKEYPRMHLGSVVGYCVHHAPCPVLVMRHADSGR